MRLRIALSAIALAGLCFSACQTANEAAPADDEPQLQSPIPPQGIGTSPSKRHVEDAGPDAG